MAQHCQTCADTENITGEYAIHPQTGRVISGAGPTLFRDEGVGGYEMRLLTDKLQSTVQHCSSRTFCRL